MLALPTALLLACRPASDLTEQARPAAPRPVLSLKQESTTADTTRLSLTLDANTGNVLGSLTGEVSAAPAWQFSACTTGQGHPLLACHAANGVVKVAAAWVEGATSGAIITLIFVRAPDVAGSGAPGTRDWQLTITEAHSVGGESMTKLLDVRPELVR